MRRLLTRRLLTRRSSCVWRGGLAPLLVGACLASSACAPASGGSDPVEVTLAATGQAVAAPRSIDVPRSKPDERDDAPAIAWAPDPAEAEREALRLQRPLLVFVGASWSTASLEMERTVFTSAAVRRAARPYLATRVDATDDPAAAAEYWLQRLDVAGVPSVVLVDATGKRRDVVVGFVAAAELTSRLNDFISR